MKEEIILMRLNRERIFYFLGLSEAEENYPYGPTWIFLGKNKGNEQRDFSTPLELLRLPVS